MTIEHRPWTGYLLASIGVIVLLCQIVLYFFGLLHHVDYFIYRPVSYLGIMLGFVGFYMINSKEAVGGATFLRDTVVAIISVVRTGKRAGDSVAVEVTPVTAGKPDPSATQTVTIPNPAAVADASSAAILEAEAAARREKHALAPPIAPEEG
jgi:hypothetical protein